MQTAGEPPEGTILFALILLGCFVFVLSICVIIWRKRNRGYRDLAEKLSLTYTWCGTHSEVEVPVFSNDDQWVVTGRNLITGDIDGVSIGISDSEVRENIIATPSERQESADSQYYDLGSACATTTILLRAKSMSLPPFQLAPRDSSEDWMTGEKGIEEFSVPGFIIHNKVTSSEPERTLEAFSSQAQKLLRTNQELSVYGREDVLIIFSHMQTMSFAEIEQALKLGLKLVDALSSESQSAD